MYPTIHIILPSYAVLACVGGFASILMLFYRIDKYGVQFTDFLKMIAICIVCGVIGSRIAFVISRVPWIINNLSLKNVISTVLGGGFVFYGGLLGVLCGIRLYSRRHGYETTQIFGMVAPAIPLFHSFGRVGCFLAGCCYGKELPNAFTVFADITISRVPTQLLEATFELVLFIIICTLQKHRKNMDYLKFYLISYATFRFFVEFLRGDELRGIFYALSTSQIISLIILTYYACRFLMRRNMDAEIPS